MKNNVISISSKLSRNNNVISISSKLSRNKKELTKMRLSYIIDSLGKALEGYCSESGEGGDRDIETVRAALRELYEYKENSIKDCITLGFLMTLKYIK